jgi:hypothetical protein
LAPGAELDAARLITVAVYPHGEIFPLGKECLPLDKACHADMSSFRIHVGDIMRIQSTILGVAALLSIGLAGCTTSGNGPSIITPALPAVDAALAVPCQEAAGDKYFMDPERVIAISSSAEGANTIVVMKADVRDAVCTINAKGKVISLVDTTPKSADQIAAEEAKLAAGGALVPEKSKKK